MSCGVCPKDRFDSGLSLRAIRALYSGGTRASGYGGCGQRISETIRAYAMNVNNQETNYGRQAMKISGYQRDARAQRYGLSSTNAVPNLYLTAPYIPVAKLDFGPKLEARVDDLKSLNSIESLLESESVYKISNEFDELNEKIINLGRVAAEKRRIRLKDEIKELRVEQNETGYNVEKAA